MVTLMETHFPELPASKFGSVFALVGICQPGTDVMIFKIFSPKNLAKKLAFFAQTTASF
jgi:hypothetical protein